MTKLAERLGKLHKSSYQLSGATMQATEEFGDAMFLMLSDDKWNCSRFGASEILSRYRLRTNCDGEYPKYTPLMEERHFIEHGFATTGQLEEHFADERDEIARREKADRRRYYEQLKAEFEGKE